MFGLSGHGHFDLTAYEKYFSGALTDELADDETLAKAAASIPQLTTVGV